MPGPLNADSPAAPFFVFLRAMNPNVARQLRLQLVLGRAAHWPTVWSNCLAGWWLGGGGNYWKLPFLLFGVSALFTGGAFLNDAFDAESDQRRRPERPVPAGKISGALVWRLGFGQLGLGIFLLLFCGQVAAGAAFFLVLFVLLYNFSHQFFTASPGLLGACRFWVYVIAGATGANGLNGWPIFCGLALAFYVAGLGGVARRENFRGPVPFGPLLLLAAPVVLALAMNTGSFRLGAIWIAAVAVAWIVRSVRPIFLGGSGNASLIAANLLAGIVLADWLAVAPICPWKWQLVFPALFALAKLLQKILPAA
jgi:4-hydroxybenzoate polyprenyltransferase